jgi:hypothetical protein
MPLPTPQAAACRTGYHGTPNGVGNAIHFWTDLGQQPDSQGKKNSLTNLKLFEADSFVILDMTFAVSSSTSSDGCSGRVALQG